MVGEAAPGCNNDDEEEEEEEGLALRAVMVFVFIAT